MKLFFLIVAAYALFLVLFVRWWAGIKRKDHEYLEQLWRVLNTRSRHDW